jgi:Tfp pilus assembly protein PilX
LIVVTVILHVIGLALMNERLVQVKRIAAKGVDSILAFALAMSTYGHQPL